MKKIKKLLFVIILLGVVFCFSDVYAEEDPYVMIGTHKITSGYDDDLYGGHVKLTDTELILDSVTIDECYVKDSRYFNYKISLFLNKNIESVKLIGNNTFNSVGPGKEKIDLGDGDYFFNYYYGVAFDDYESELLLYGDGSLTINAENYNGIHGVYHPFVSIGKNDGSQGPTINFNFENFGGTLFSFIGLSNVYNSNININLDISDYPYPKILGLYGEAPMMVYNSNIYINSNYSSTAEYLLFFSTSSSYYFKNCNIYVNIDSNIETDDGIIFAYAETTFTLEDSNSYFNVPNIFKRDEEYPNDVIKFVIKKSSGGNVDNYFAGKNEGLFEFVNVDNNMIYTSTTTRDALSNSTPFNNDIIDNYKYVHIKSSNNYEVLSGNNQKINGNEFIFKLNAPKIFLSGLYLDDVLLDESDYNYSDDGTVTLTSTGLNKIKELNNGPHKIQARYVNDKTVDVDFEVGEGSTLNPDTIDYVLVYFFSLFISIVFIFTVLKVIRKREINF